MKEEPYNTRCASDLGWHPGEWPQEFEHNGDTYFFDHNETHKGELIAAFYKPSGKFPKRKMIKVYND